MATPETIKGPFNFAPTLELVDGIVADLSKQHIPADSSKSPWLANGNEARISQHPDSLAHSQIVRTDDGWQVNVLRRKLDATLYHCQTIMDTYTRAPRGLSQRTVDIYRSHFVPRISIRTVHDLRALNSLFGYLYEDIPRPLSAARKAHYDYRNQQTYSRAKSQERPMPADSLATLRRGSFAMRLYEHLLITTPTNIKE